MKTNLSHLTLITLILSMSVFAQDSTSIDRYNDLPKGVYDTLVETDFFDAFDVYFQMETYAQYGDFNGDGAVDAAIQIINNNSHKRGIIFLHANDENIYLIGAGKAFAELGDDFKWLNSWRIDSFTRLSEGSESLILTHPDHTKSLLYFDGNNYAFQGMEAPPNYSSGPIYGEPIPQLLLRLPGMYPHQDL